MVNDIHWDITVKKTTQYTHACGENDYLEKQILEENITKDNLAINFFDQSLVS